MTKKNARTGKPEAGESKYTLALEVVSEWVEELMRRGHERKEALETLLVLVEMRMIGSRDEEVGSYRTELDAIIRSQLGQTNDLKGL